MRMRAAAATVSAQGDEGSMGPAGRDGRAGADGVIGRDGIGGETVAMAWTSVALLARCVMIAVTALHAAETFLAAVLGMA